MVAVEAQSCGCPVIAFGAGGSSETVQDGRNGVLFAEQHADDVIGAVRRFETMTWSADQVRHQVESFSCEAFKTRIRRFVEERATERQRAAGAEIQSA
jgi:glycosyltransferase involved in cell wall biosynthesis